MLFRVMLSAAVAAGCVGSQQLSDTAESALARCGDAREAYESAWQTLGMSGRRDLEFLLRHMPAPDFEIVKPKQLVETVRLSRRARGAVTWGRRLPDVMYRNYVLPYVQANETRESWRATMLQKFLPLVKECRTPGEAARKLNEQIFNIVNVHYSTARKRADQSPSESIAQGKASCTGLSILLADACRACCIPARLVSVRWPHKPGNHTWVEVWDGQEWRFCGADEPDPQGLDRAWFTSDAAKCADADREHRVWAVSFAETGERFAAGWGRVKLWGVDVTSRYAPKPKADRLGRSGGDDALLAQLARYFASDAARQATFEFDRNLDEELRTKDGDARLRKLVFQALRIHEQQRLLRDHNAQVVSDGGKTSPFTVRQIGKMPADGWPLVIAMHGGGGVPKAVNDAQWRQMETYYRDHPAGDGYLYCALRAPTDEWNGFYTEYFYPVVEKLIRQFVVCDEVNPDRVTAIGYSHGGYGAFAIGPKMPHRFAAVHASAAAPTDGQSSPEGLHSLPFSFMVGGRDTDFGRRDRCVAFDQQLQKLKEQDPLRYPAKFMLVESCGHADLPDRDLLEQMVPQRRVVSPMHLTWRQTDRIVCDHYWLRVPKPIPGRLVDAQLIEHGAVLSDLSHCELWLDARLVDFTKPFAVVMSPTHQAHQESMPSPSLRTLCYTMAERGDPQLAATWIISVP